MAFQYGHCDSFFVIDDTQDHDAQRHAVRRRQAEAQHRKQVQDAIAKDMSEMDKDEYGDDILSYLSMLEYKALPDVFSIDMQTEIKWHMRPYLLDFLIEVHQSFGLLPETLFLAINLLDRYCSRRVVFKKHYQLVGCTALLLAAKYNETSKRVPHIRELQSMCCDQYDEDMFVQMERHVLTNLEWFVGGPTIEEFLQMAMEGTAADNEVRNMALYISMISLMHRDFVSVRPSEVAKCSLHLARIVLERQEQAEGSSAWVFQFDQNILVALSHHLQTPSKVLKNIFRHHSLDCVSVHLDNFLYKLATQSQQQTASNNASSSPNTLTSPGTPPRHTDAVAEKGNYSADPAGLYTPQKNPYGPTMVVTPPLTPENEQFQPAHQVGQQYKTHYPPPPHMVVPSIHVSAPPTPVEDIPTDPYYHVGAYTQPMQPGMSTYYDPTSSIIM